MEEEKEIIELPFGKKTFFLHIDLDFNKIDMDEVTMINYSNLYGEMVTISNLVNKVGILRAEAESNMETAKLDRDIKYAHLDEHYRLKLRKPHINSKKEEVMKDPTNDAVEAAIKRDPEYIQLFRRYIRNKRSYNQIDALFWGVKSKEKKLDKIGESMSLAPEEFSKNIVEGRINCMLIKSHAGTIDRIQ